MKVYVHYEDEAMEYTSIVHCEPQDPLSSLCQNFIVAVRSAYPTLHIDPAQYQLRNEKGKILSVDWPVAKCSIAPGDDLFVVPAPLPPAPAKAAPKEDKKKKKKAARITAEDRRTADKLKEEGNERMKRGEFASAVEYYSDALLVTPDSAVLYGNRSQAYLNLQRYELALDDASMATQMDSTFAKGYLRAGKAAMALKRGGVAHGHFVRGLRVTDQKNDKLSKTMSREFRKLIQEAQLLMTEERAQAATAPPPDAPSAPAPAADAPALSSEQKEQVIEQLQRSLETMRDHFSAGRLRKAKAVCEEVLEVVKGEKLTTHYLSTILIAAEKYEEALRVLQPAVEIHPKELELRLSLGEAYFQTGNYQKAYSTLSAAQKLAHTPADSNRAAIRRARCLLKLKRESEASAIISELLQKDQNNTEALVEYGSILLDRGIQQEAIKVFLRSLILNSEDKTIRRKLALAARAPGGLDTLLKELQDANSASALGFLALIFKDYGALEQSATLFKGAAVEAPANATYTLNYIHVLEILGRYSESYEFIRTFLAHNAQLALPYSEGAGELPCGTILATLEGLHDVESALAQRTQGQGQAQARHPLGEGYVPAEQKKAHGFSPDQLDLLALLFTLVKILFLQGQLETVQRLVQTIEQVRRGKELHMTSIRNEHAYYCCVAQLLPHLQYPLAPSPPLYVVGDSHTLPVAWQELTLPSGEKRFTIPKLVTGCKMWHLRPESYFFTKDNFYNMIHTVPAGETVIFLFGEIDCREGILVAVEKCRYESVQEGIDHTIEIFMQVLEEIKQQKNLTILIHPVVPVLNETRSMVKQFNTTLQQKVAEHPDFRWLDFYEQLLTEDMEHLRQEYALDGTHLHPSYLTLLEKAL